MPLYEYECEAQGHRFEVIQKFSDPPIEKCRQCGSPVRKLIASPAFQFKGSGWYITDYAKKDGGGSAKTASKDGGESASTEKPADKSSDKGSADKSSSDKGSSTTAASTSSTSTKSE